MKRLLLLLLAAWVFSAIPAVLPPGAEGQDEPPYPTPQGYVTDTRGLLSGTERGRLEGLLGELQRRTGAQLTVAIVSSTRPLPVDDYAVELFTRWGVGEKDKDNGILLVVALDDRQLWIEVGYGLEGAVPDATASRIYREILQPAFRAGCGRVRRG